MSGKQLTQESDFFSYLEPVDVVLADRGFTIAEDVMQNWKYLPSHEGKCNLHNKKLSSLNNCPWYASM